MIKRILFHLQRILCSPETFARRQGVSIGTDNFINTPHFGTEPYLITIGSHCQITAGVKFHTHGGAQVLRDRDPHFDFFGKIKIGDYVYIGNDAQIMPRVTLGDHTLVAAGSIVTKSWPQGNIIIGGNPAREIGNIESFAQKMGPYNLKSKDMTTARKREFLLSLPDDRFVQK